MTERYAKLPASLSHEDQLELLKDSIDLRFSSPEINEFAPLKGSDTPYVPRSFKSNKSGHERLPFFAADMAFSNMIEYDNFKRQLRYVCSCVILLGLFTPFINIVSANETFSGVQLTAGLWQAFGLNLLPAIIVIGVAIFPVMLFLYAAAIAIVPRTIALDDNLLTKLWSITATSGILYFFAAFMFINLEGQTVYTLTNTIGFGYYVTMITIFTYHFLTQLADQTIVT
ncbi:MAG: hypothetical protein AAF902_13350 [Chloroflexota bacterium]